MRIYNIVKIFMLYTSFDIEILIFLFICRKLKFQEESIVLDKLVYFV